MLQITTSMDLSDRGHNRFFQFLDASHYSWSNKLDNIQHVSFKKKSVTKKGIIPRQIQNTHESGGLVKKFKIQNLKFKIQNSKCEIQQ